MIKKPLYSNSFSKFFVFEFFNMVSLGNMMVLLTLISWVWSKPSERLYVLSSIFLRYANSGFACINTMLFSSHFFSSIFLKVEPVIELKYTSFNWETFLLSLIKVLCPSLNLLYDSDNVFILFFNYFFTFLWSYWRHNS